MAPQDPRASHRAALSRLVMGDAAVLNVREVIQDLVKKAQQSSPQLPKG